MDMWTYRHFSVGDIFWRKAGQEIETLINTLQQKPTPPTSMLVDPSSELACVSVRLDGRSRINPDTELCTLPANYRDDMK